MTLTVEDGTGLSNADAYQGIADIQTYAVSRMLSFDITDVPKAEGAARRAAVFLDSSYRTRLPGQRVKGRAQSREWPRKNAYDAAGQAIASDEVPAEWLDANAEVAIRELASPGALSPDVVTGKIKKSVTVVGAVSVTYADDADLVGSQRPTLTLVDDLLSGLLSTALETGRAGVFFLGRA